MAVDEMRARREEARRPPRALWRHLLELKDRVGRDDVACDDYYRDMTEVTAEVRDLMERVYETAALNNVDVFNNRVDIQENKDIAFAEGLPYGPNTHRAFTPPDPIAGRPLPLSDRAQQYHRRFSAIEVFEDLLRKQPEILSKWIRPPAGASRFFDRRMPALMRGPSGDPLHLTRRQYDLLRGWVQRLSNGSSKGPT